MLVNSGNIRITSKHMYGKIITVTKVFIVSSSVRYYSKDSSKKLLGFLASMPKPNSGRIFDAQRQRQQLSKKAEKYGPSTVYLQVLGSGARGAPNTLYLFTDQKRYLFNCGEGSQRLAHEHRVKLSKLDHIFITNKTWRNIGGLPGLSLTLQDVGVPNITLHGPDGLDELYNATKRFVIMKDMNVTMAKCSPSVDFEDNVMTVKYVLMGPQDNIFKTDSTPTAKKPKLGDECPGGKFEEFIHDDTDYYRREAKPPEEPKNKSPKTKLKICNKDPLMTKNEKVLHELQKQSHCTVAYICTLKKRLGTLVLEKCVELGVKPGPLLGQLKSGQDVVLPDGRLVRSQDVKTPDDPGPVFIVLEVPDLSYLRESEFDAHYENETNPPENIPAVVVHYTPPHVLNHPKYRAFMSRFGATTQHLVLNAQNTCMGSEAVHRSQHRLHLLDEEMFPLLRDASVPALWAPGPRVGAALDGPRLRGLEELKNKIAEAQFQNIISMEGWSGDAAPAPRAPLGARTLTALHLRPRRQLDRSAEPKLHIQEYIQEAMDVDGFVESLEKFRKLVEKIRYEKNGAHKEYPKVVFLGTGSCIPSKTRNTSAIVLQIDEQRSMLMDCGEGTFGQLVRFFGPKKVNAFLRTLKAIYISHLHADHHIGLIDLLQARRQALEEVNKEGTPVYLLAPGQIVSWLSIYDQEFERIRDEFTLIPNQDLLEGKCSETNAATSNMTSAVLASIGVQYIRTCYVAHCPNAFGVAIDVDQQYKITYSGDTIPCPELVEIGKNSTLLIHEATMEDELAGEARIKMHSTTSQAINIGREMNAKYTILTHFSQRYARLPRLNAHILNDNNTVGIAFDNMQITMDDLELLPHMYAPLQLMFAEHCVELELKAANRARKEERQRLSPTPPTLDSKRNYSTYNHKEKDTNVNIQNGTTDNMNTDHQSNGENITDNDRNIISFKRKRSPSCGSRVPAQYRESHASRLRQERYRSLSDDRKRGQRSTSGSPTKNFTRSFLPKQLLSKDSAPQSPERGSDATPRTASQSSNLCKDVKKNHKTSSNNNHADTNSKTRNKVPTIGFSLVDASNNKTNKNLNKHKKALSFSCPETKPNSGYGKPLMTPIHKKLILRQELCSRTSSASDDKSPSRLTRSRTPTLGKENRPTLNAASSNTRVIHQQRALNIRMLDIMTSILYHLLFWKLHHVVACLSHLQWQLMITIIAVGYLFWTAINTVSGSREKNPGISTSSNSRSNPKSSITKTMPLTKPLKQPITQQRSSSSSRRQSLDRKDGETPTSKRQLSNSRLPVVQKRSSSRENDKNIEAVMKSTSSSRESLHARGRTSSVSRDGKPSPINGKKFANHSSKSFKPQLEDIKSSFLLLNKNKDAQENNEFDKMFLSKLQPTREKQRNEKLLEAMKKFKTKKYWNDSKYDKIEGLNWITWK
ncbi:ribonuclease Z, mitochondrial [Nymphalis io]|uniref:ribonuclease Z, mitochondrial n=1 Tax=Inachis io TaxID=171585 RepID=UPI0021693634|nr:ribonuclease Z, mitochondrial [Nymphalis io]